MLAEQNPIIADAARTIYCVTEDERIRQHCDAREIGERTHRTLLKQIEDRDKQIADKDAALAQRDSYIAELETKLRQHNN